MNFPSTTSVSCTGGAYDALSDELRKLGWVEGTSILIEHKEAGGHIDRLPALAADLVRSKPDLIVAVSPQPARAAKDATSEIPIVMLFVADPVGVGLATSLAHPLWLAPPPRRLGAVVHALRGGVAAPPR